MRSGTTGFSRASREAQRVMESRGRRVHSPGRGLGCLLPRRLPARGREDPAPRGRTRGGTGGKEPGSPSGLRPLLWAHPPRSGEGLLRRWERVGAVGLSAPRTTWRPAGPTVGDRGGERFFQTRIPSESESEPEPRGGAPRLRRTRNRAARLQARAPHRGPGHGAQPKEAPGALLWARYTDLFSCSRTAGPPAIGTEPLPAQCPASGGGKSGVRFIPLGASAPPQRLLSALQERG